VTAASVFHTSIAATALLHTDHESPVVLLRRVATGDCLAARERRHGSCDEFDSAYDRRQASHCRSLATSVRQWTR